MSATWLIARRWGSTGWTSKYRAMTRSVGRFARSVRSELAARGERSPQRAASARAGDPLLGHRPGPRLLAHGDAEAGPVGQVHAPVADLEPFVEQRVEPVEVLDPRLDRVGRREVDVDLHREVRRELQVAVLGERG